MQRDVALAVVQPFQIEVVFAHRLNLWATLWRRKLGWFAFVSFGFSLLRSSWSRLKAGFLQQAASEWVLFFWYRTRPGRLVLNLVLMPCDVQNVAGHEVLGFHLLTVHFDTVTAAKITDMPVTVGQLKFTVV